MPCFSSTSPSTVGIGLENLGRLLGEQEARHDIGHEPQPARRRDRRSARRASGWSARLSTAVAWVWSTNLCGRNACSSVSTDGLGAPGSSRLARCTRTMSSSASASRGAQFAQRREPHRRQPGRLDRRHVPAAALDAQHLGLARRADRQPRLDRGVAAAMQHQPRVAARAGARYRRAAPGRGRCRPRRTAPRGRRRRSPTHALFMAPSYRQSRGTKHFRRDDGVGRIGRNAGGSHGPIHRRLCRGPTPLTAALEPDLDRYVRHCQWLLANGCDGLAPLGTTGEANSLSLAQRLALVEAAAAGGRADGEVHSSARDPARSPMPSP